MTIEAIKFKPELSVVISCFQEELNIQSFHHSLVESLNSLNRSYEILYVNDGSSDGTADQLTKISQETTNDIRTLHLPRNLGQYRAIARGIAQIKGNNLLLLDCDQQFAPQDLLSLVAKLDEGYDFINGTRAHRNDPLIRVLLSRIANKAFSFLCGKSCTDIGCNFRLIRGSLIDKASYQDKDKFVFAEILQRSSKYLEVPVTHFARKFGKSGWSLRSLLELFVDNLFYGSNVH